MILKITDNFILFCKYLYFILFYLFIFPRFYNKDDMIIHMIQ